ncbi:malonate--CoA ligase ACSF3, mitochondrial [Aricia agestis]|uniref:malonate--CoA ligase ACSF3, mitochondrial n=1 Tax=Aricia agestis TaxID=91739 RepID=UPI001C202B65|nr:malonate--CoA ligase ACSF3, mitochondrial [Aricia agestis]XP_041975593.1 malonate--CoA ligase ACSF3, mitochondrial [Aricia agestis]
MIDKSLRHLNLFARFFRKPVHISNIRWFSAAAVKEDLNLDLLKAYNEDIRAGGVVPVFKKALLFPSRTALQDNFGTYTYREVYDAASALSKSIAKQLIGEKECTICYMCPNNVTHVVVQWAIWMTGNIAVPLTPLHPQEMLKYFVTDSYSNLIICTEDYEKRLQPVAQELKRPLIVYNKTDLDRAATSRDEGSLSNSFYAKTEAMLIYTSGTTSKPKGVVWTHSMLASATAALHAAWRYSAADVVLHALPLHHIHGQLNSLHASLAAGARIRMLPSFASHAVWAELLGRAVVAAAGDGTATEGAKSGARVTVFHGVPAMYSRLAADWKTLFADGRTRRHVRDTLARMRLMCAGSAPLPDTLYDQWLEISGHRLLERYGMSEVGMALSNPYRPAEARAVGCVGLPLPGVAARLAAAPDPAPGAADAPPAADQLQPLVTVECDAPDTQVSPEALGLVAADPAADAWAAPRVTEHAAVAAARAEMEGGYQGELLLRGPAVFSRYWNRLPQLSTADFTPDGWFRTGDTAAWAGGRFRILGRTSVDIIKSGGYKVSALQVEAALLATAGVADAAVLGVAHAELGEAVAAVLVLRPGRALSLPELRAAAAARLAPYQLPRALLVVDAMSRNAMGKLDKKEIRRLYEKDLMAQLKR